MTRITSSLRRARPLLALLLLLCMLAPAGRTIGAPPAPRTLIPIGSGYAADTLQRFARAAAARDTSGTVLLVVIPSAFGLSADATSPSERRKNLALADTRRAQVETACNAVRASSQQCHAVLAPLLIRDDALQPANAALFTDDVDGMYILGGDQTVAMQVLADTPVEQRMAALYAAGAVVSGNSAGAAVESLTMIAGYTGNNGPENGFQQGSVDLWQPEGVSDRTRGLIFGLPNALLDQHALQRGRIARLINAAYTTGLLGIGADAETATAIIDETRLTDVTGRSAAYVVDLDTYGATGNFAGPTSSLAIRRVATHLVPSGPYGYDLAQRRPLVGNQPVAPPPIAGRTFAALRTPAGHGTLLLGGDLSNALNGPAAERFVALSGATSSIVVLTAGYARPAESRAAAKAHAAALEARTGTPVRWFALDDRYDAQAALAAINGATAIWLTSPDQSRVLTALNNAAPLLNAVRARWQNGATLLADNAAAAAFGSLMTIDPPPPSTTAELEEASIIDFRPDGVTIQPGLGFLPGVAVEPRLLPDRHWGRLYNLAAHSPALLGLGIDPGTAVELTPAGAITRGTSVALTLDGRAASFGTGANGSLSARYVVLDTFVDGDAIQP
jgi:cyanophycinase